MGIFDSFKRMFNKEEASEMSTDKSIEEITTNKIEYEIDEEDRVVVALTATVMAGKDKPNSEFHISKITRIK